VNGTGYTIGEFVTNSGTIQLQSGNLYIDWFDYWGQINNLTNGLVDVQADVSIDANSGQGLINQGTVQKSGGTGVSGINSVFSNSGTLDVQTGTVSLNGTGSGGGLFEAEAGATLVFSNNYEVDGVLSGAGTNVIADGTFTLTGSMTISNTVLEGGTLMGNNGVMSGLITWTSGALGNALGGVTLAANGVLVLAGANGTDYPLGEYFTNAGTILLQSGNLQLDWVEPQYGELINLPGATVTFASDVSIDDVGGSPGLFNQGTVRKSGGAGVSGINTALNNSGTLDVQTGTVSVNAACSLTGGTLNFGINGLGNFGQVVLSENPATLDGSVSANLNNGYVPSAGSSFPVVTFAAESGMFAHALLPPGFVWQTNYGATAFSFAVSTPVLATPRWLGNGQFQFTFNTVAGSAYTIQYSTNLIHWTSVLELQGNGTTLTLIDLNATDKARFYRILSP
jgi:hypothetical protein